MSRRLLLVASLLAGAQMVTGTSAFTDIVAGRWAALVAVVVGAAQLALATYAHGLQTPVPGTTTDAAEPNSSPSREA